MSNNEAHARRLLRDVIDANPALSDDARELAHRMVDAMDLSDVDASDITSEDLKRVLFPTMQ
jgi:hypothetical protein